MLKLFVESNNGAIVNVNETEESRLFFYMQYKDAPSDIVPIKFLGSASGTEIIAGKFTGGAALTGTPTAPTAEAGTNTTQIATTAFVNAAVKAGFAANDAMVYKGIIAGTSTSPGKYTPAAMVGETYRVSTAGYVNGIKVEVGDILICVTDTVAATSSNYSTIKSNWNIIQSNLDGAVIGPASAVDARVAVFNGTTGKIIKDSGFTIGKSVPSDAKFTDTTYSAGTGISLSGTTFSNSGVRSVATGTANGTISVNTNGTTANVAVKGLGSAAYTNSTAYATAGHTHSTIKAVSGSSWTSATRNITEDCLFEFSSHISKSATGLFTTSNNANAIISFNRHSGDHASQLGFSQNGKIYYRSGNGTAIVDSTPWAQLYTTNDFKISSFTASRMCYTTANGELYSGYHYADNTHLGVGYTGSTAPDYTLYVGKQNSSAGTLGVETSITVGNNATAEYDSTRKALRFIVS